MSQLITAETMRMSAHSSGSGTAGTVRAPWRQIVLGVLLSGLQHDRAANRGHETKAARQRDGFGAALRLV